MTESAELARRLGLKLHTHLAETVEEEAYCRELYGCTPVEYLDRLGWLDGDVWCAHCVHLSDAEIARFAETGTGVAHCPTSNLRLGAGVAPGAVDGGRRRSGRSAWTVRPRTSAATSSSRSSRRCSSRGPGGRQAMTAREALRLGTRGGAAVLGATTSARSRRDRCADLAVWATDGLEWRGRPGRGSRPSQARSGSTASTSAASSSSAAVPSCARTRARSLAPTARRP